MTSSHLALKGGGALAALLTLSTGLPAQQQVCFTDSVALTPTNWTDTMTVSKFDPALGVLTGIDFILSGEEQGSAAVESLDGSPTTVTTQFQATITLTRPDMSVIVVTVPAAIFTDDLAAFDGIVDFMGPSGETHGGIVANDMDSASSTDPMDLALFTGMAGNPGTIDLPVTGMGTSTASGSGNLISQFMTSAASDVQVCYTYELDCNGNGIPDSDDIGQGNSNDVTPDGIPDECQPATTSFCEGDGSANGGADCPCMNNGNPGEGCDNGSGSGALMTASGVPSVSNDTLSITVTGVQPTTPGFFFFGADSSGGGGGVPFGSGLRCIDFAVPVLKQNGGGTIPSGMSPPLSVLLNIQPGATNYFQYWYRNPTGPCPGLSANTTNGVQVTWGL
jgi:hypothetical protein